MIIIIRKPKNLTYHKLIRKSSQILVLYLTKYTSYDCSFHCWLWIKYNSIEKITLITRYSDIPSSGWAIGSSGKWCKAALATSACQEEKYYCISLLLVTGNTFTLNELFFSYTKSTWIKHQCHENKGKHSYCQYNLRERLIFVLIDQTIVENITIRS